MKFEVEGKKYNFPASLRDITLGQRIDFYNRFGKDHEKENERIKDIEDEFEKNIESTALGIKMAVDSFSFFTDLDIELIKEKFDLNQILNVYYTSTQLINEQEKAVKLESEYVWNNELWYIEYPTVTAQSKFTFNEFITAKETIRQLKLVSESDFTALHYLACVFLRKKDEAFNDDFLNPQSERFKLMRELPMDIALGVGFFLTNSIQILLNSQSLTKESN